MVPDLLAPTPEMRQKCIAVLPDLHAALSWLRGRLHAAEASDPFAGTGIACD